MRHERGQKGRDGSVITNVHAVCRKGGRALGSRAWCWAREQQCIVLLLVLYVSHYMRSSFWTIYIYRITWWPWSPWQTPFIILSRPNYYRLSMQMHRVAWTWAWVWMERARVVHLPTAHTTLLWIFDWTMQKFTTNWMTIMCLSLSL